MRKILYYIFTTVLVAIALSAIWAYVYYGILPAITLSIEWVSSIWRALPVLTIIAVVIYLLCKIFNKPKATKENNDDWKEKLEEWDRNHQHGNRV